MSYIDNSSEAEYSTSELTDKEAAVELVGVLDIVSNYRQLLEDLRGDGWFRLRFRDDVSFSDICILSSAFLLERDESRDMGAVADWMVTNRANRLLDAVPSDVNVTPDESDALFSIGKSMFEIPKSGIEWKLRDLDDAEIADRSLGVLRDADLLEMTNDPLGHPSTWTATERLDEIKHTLIGVVDE
ncbi:hypothetical protein GRS48_14035 [Halorubrum sp. JWXQ-INN 858]|uniref:hypothetical protein n=1 Tax=Halorubrum sp. JWXQ-INN 858 TaxID=2690782 RepID=UPI001359A2DE|nr:hypothetical protein [Halorubrum sp. JWXQ-INN 858]MWV65930.1 hypothetical protein [Halorubrum sp. JWXQ-INN 858]